MRRCMSLPHLESLQLVIWVHYCMAAWLHIYLITFTQRDINKRCDQLVKGHSCAAFTTYMISKYGLDWEWNGME